jgi:hypothetical protein
MKKLRFSDIANLRMPQVLLRKVRNAYKIFVIEPEDNRLFERLRGRWKNKIKTASSNILFPLLPTVIAAHDFFRKARYRA